jgi:hypothetical protein
MNAKQRRQYEMLLRLRDFRNAHQELFAQSPVAQEAFESVNAAITELTATDLVKMSASASARADRQKRARTTLIDVLTKVSQLVRVLQARGQSMPVFQLPASRSDQTLLSTARQFAHDGAPFEAEFAAHGVAPKLIADTATAFETAVSDRGTKRADAIAARARIRELLAAAFLDVRRLDLILDSALAGNTAIREVWKQIRHVLEARGARSGSTTDNAAQPPAPSPAPTPPVGSVAAEPLEELEPVDAEDSPTPATVIPMPVREVA